MPDTLATVLRIRRVTLDDARRHLAHTIRAEVEATREAEAAEAAISEEGEAAADLMAGDGAVEAYAAWLPVGRARAASASQAAVRAGSEVAKARAGVMLAQAAAEAAESLLQRRRDAQVAEANRKAQIETDEIAGRIKAPADR